jgi:hypothetical protein
MIYLLMLVMAALIIVTGIAVNQYGEIQRLKLELEGARFNERYILQTLRDPNIKRIK